MAFKLESDIILLLILLALVFLIAWFAVRKGNKKTEGMMNIDYDMMPPDATHAPEFEAEMVYGDPTDSFGMGAGASEQTTNDWTLL